MLYYIHLLNDGVWQHRRISVIGILYSFCCIALEFSQTHWPFGVEYFIYVINTW